MAEELAKRNIDSDKIFQKNLEKFSLFTSNTDKFTQDIFEISNPFETVLPILGNSGLPMEGNAIFSINGDELINFASLSEIIRPVIFDENTGTFFQPDFDELSSEVKKKLDAGIYKLGDSKKVEGNVRAVIVDTQNHNRRVEDITLREVKNSNASHLSDIATQLQLKQIYEIVLDIQDTQNFQLKWDRNNSMLSPFFSARTKIIEAQDTPNLEEKRRLLERASDYMEDSVSAVKSDLITNKEAILKKVNQPTYRYESFKRHADFILEDIQISTLIVGMQLHIDLTLEKKELAKNRFLAYQNTLKTFSDKNIPKNQNFAIHVLRKIPVVKEWEVLQQIDKTTVLEIIHDYYKYSSTNLNFWLELDWKVQDINNSLFLEDSKKELLDEGESEENG